MSVGKIVEALELAETFAKLGFLFRADICLNIAIESLNVCNYTNLQILFLRRKHYRLRMLVDKEINKRNVIKIKML